MLPFDDETVARVAADSGVTETALRDAAESVQATLADYPGRSVDGLVYEWRQAFRDDPLVERRPDAWILRVPERVWVDVRERADVPDDVQNALVALYATETDETEDGVALVIARDSASD
ncbi:hypothetical protein [Halobacterium sp. KA-6]|jgi:hypothetical protein|uniref:hypothetical protein n=1 Tax=Halobacterium sp. KA-6 TaxID=2896368 RepID=UPI001E32474B|nr:hypothetical protein [Halobacterium sp. KA-6]MCD2204480.1 hypothetical protein [Halobacterium sp. KA-6]